MSNIDIDIVYQINNITPLYVDYRDKQHVFIWCVNNLDLDAGQYGTVHLQASVWIELPFEQGTKLHPVGINPSSPQNFVVVVRASNSQFQPFPVPIQFDISNLSVNTAGPDLLAAIGIPYYKLVAMQLTGTWTGNVAPLQSIDGVNYVQCVMTQIGDTTQTRSINASANGIYRIPLIGRYFRANVSALSSGTVVGSFLFFMNPVDF